MNWTELSVTTTRAGIEVLGGVLSALGITAFSISDPEDLLEQMKSDTGWDLVDEEYLARLADEVPEIRVYLADNAQAEKTASSLLEALDSLRAADAGKELGDLAVSVSRVDEDEWADSWKKYFKAFPVGNRLLVKPVWEELTEATERIVVSVDPASSFGSGMHESTRLCLKALEDFVKPGDIVADVGSGSGILSAAAALLGAARVDACDLDGNAVLTTGASAGLNGVADRVTSCRSDLAGSLTGTYDVLVANLFSNLIVRLCPDLRRVLRRGGLFLGSGIITDGLGDVLHALESAGLLLEDVREDGEWRLVAARMEDKLV